ncbi:MAG: alkene reductase [Geminicoccaceae bacterium]
MTVTADSQNGALFTPVRLGSLEVPHRVLMAPLTRNRAHSDGTPHELAVTYYRQRASAGLIITEATQISAMGKGYIDTPGIHNDAQGAAWKQVTDAVHEAGGRILVQLWHVGRISHVSLLPDGELPVAPSAIRAEAQTYGPEGFVDCSMPRALASDEIPALIDEYRHATRLAMAAGFDGVEVHSANGYLLDQFLHANANQRTDAYGGSAENRARLTIEVTRAVAEIIGADKVGVRLSPTGRFNDMDPSGEEPTFAAAVDGLNDLGLAYLHVVEQFPGAKVSDVDIAVLDRLHDRWRGAYIANGDFDTARANDWIGRKRADAIAFGRTFLANPDLPERLRQGAPLNEPDHATFYGGDHRGYTDYPFLEEVAAA